MEKTLILIVAVIGLILLSGCTQTQYVCSDGSIVSSPGLCNGGTNGTPQPQGPKTITAKIEPDPILVMGYLTVSVVNTTNSDAEDIVVTVQAESSYSILIEPSSRTIPALGRGESRTMQPFVVRLNPDETIYSGIYGLNIKTTINGQVFEEKIMANVKGES